MSTGNILKKIIDYIWNLIYPQKCTVCGKLGENILCKKCEIKLNTKKIYGYEILNNQIGRITYIYSYTDIIRELLIKYKFNECTYLYKTIVKLCSNDKKIFEIFKQYDTIITVPISKKRLKQRGYDQVDLIFRNIVNQLELENQNEVKKQKLNYRSDILVKEKNIISQSKLNKIDRELNVKGAFSLDKSKINNIKGTKILLIDDIYTTGSTVLECAKVLKKEISNLEIDVLVIAKD